MTSFRHRLLLGALAASTLAALPAPEAHAAAYATGGSGQYRNEILWLTWGGGDNGVAGVGLANGDTTTATIPVTATQDLVLTCSLSDIVGAIETYRPGGYTGDGLDDLYNIGGTGTGNQLVAGIMGRVGVRDFTVNCQATLGGVPYRIPGLVMADAESLETGGTEYLQGSAHGAWNVVELNPGNGNAYIATRNALADGRQSIRFGPGGQGGGTSPAGITFLTFSDAAYGAGETISMDFQILGGGNTAIAIGLLAPAADFGDAPASYGEAAHVLQALVAAPDGLQPGQAANINAPGFQLGALLPPAAGFLGSTGPDGEPGPQHSADARGDDANGSAGVQEEDGWPADYVLALTSATPPPLTQVVACNGTGTVAGWFDFDRDGLFDADERAQAACTGGSASLSWAVPTDVSAGTSYVRLRYASNAADVASPTDEAADGEVEDHAVEIRLGVDVSLAKSVSPANAAVGQTVTYTLDVGNAGPFAADGSLVTDPPVVGLACLAAAPVACTARDGATCPAAATVADLQGAGLAIPLLPVGGGVVLSFACTIAAPDAP